MKGYLKHIFAFMMAALLGVASCQTADPEETGPAPDSKEGITNIDNKYEDKNVSYRGGTITIKFDSSAPWTAALDSDYDWVEISSTPSGEAGACTVRLAFEKNESDTERTVKLYVTLDGAEPELVATVTQAASGESADAAINKALNTYMHEILTKDYLFKDAYNAQDIDLTLNYTDFLQAHLLYLGEANIEDGGYYKASHTNPGGRYIYTSFQEVAAVSASEQPMAVQTGGLGFGPFISTALRDDGSIDMGIAPSYVRRGSPAEAAGMQRGDLIFEVNGTRLTTSNYRDYMTSLYQNPYGSYTFGYLRYEENEQGGYDHNAYVSEVATTSVHIYDPVLHASILTYPQDPSIKIGYFVYESFDLGSQDLLEETVNWFVENQITDLILDLRFNAGGAVAQSRWLSGCIAGAANRTKTFTKVVYNNGAEENWTFDYGYNNDVDPLGLPIDLGLDRLYVICSYNTASAAELVISSLRGVDFPVKMIGGTTEGKNVGMTVSETTWQGRHFQFAPITFWVRNAKGWGDYADGIAPDEFVNNDNGNYNDDADNVFPYSFGSWENMDYNIALQWAYCDITGKPRWKHTPGTAAESQPMEHRLGRFGNLVYETNN